jgi:hypothetical protein
MIEKLKPQKTIIENIYALNSNIASYLYPITLDKLKRRPKPVFPNYVNVGEVYTHENWTMIEAWMDGKGNNWRDWHDARDRLLKNSVTNNWNTEWRHMELRYAVKTDIGKCKWCKKEYMPIVKKEIIVREQITHTTFNSLHKHCALNKLIKLKDEITIGIDRLENMIDGTDGMIKGDKR